MKPKRDKKRPTLSESAPPVFVNSDVFTETWDLDTACQNPSAKRPCLPPVSSSTLPSPKPPLSGPPSTHLTGWDWYRSIGSPRFVVSPMVGQSELAFRMLCRAHGAQLAYTPMIIAARFVESASYRKAVWQTCAKDRPLVAQLCASDAAAFVAAARLIQDSVDAVDLNLGCPQSVAQRGGYGAYLMDHQELVREIVSQAARELSVPVTVKIRVFPDVAATIRYCRMLQRAGASLITVHGRLRHHREEVLSDWSAAHRIRQAVSVPVVLNGDVWHPEDVATALAEQCVDGVMSAQGILHNPAIFEPLARLGIARLGIARPEQQEKGTVDAVPPPGPTTFAWRAPAPDDRLRQRRVISPFFSFALTTVCNHPLSRARGSGFSSGSGVNTGDAAFAAAKHNGQDEEPRKVKCMTAEELKAAFAAPFTTPEDARRQFALATEYLELTRKYPVYHASMVRRHLFFMLFDNFQANLDQYDALCDADTEAAYLSIVATLSERAEAGVNKRTKNAYSAGAFGDRPRPRRRDGSIAPPPWPEGGGGHNVSRGKGSGIADSFSGGDKNGGDKKGGEKKSGDKKSGDKKSGGAWNKDDEAEKLTVVANGMSFEHAKAIGKSIARGLDPTRLKNVDLSRFD